MSWKTGPQAPLVVLMCIYCTVTQVKTVNVLKVDKNKQTNVSWLRFSASVLGSVVQQVTCEENQEIQVVPVFDMNKSRSVHPAPPPPPTTTQKCFERHPDVLNHAVPLSLSLSLSWPDWVEEKELQDDSRFCSFFCSYTSHLNDDGVLSMTGLIGEVRFLCSSVPDQDLEEEKKREMRKHETDGEKNWRFCLT